MNVTLRDMKPGPRRTATWGLGPCAPELTCKVCAMLSDTPERMHSLRELYTEGTPVWLVARTYGIPNNALRSHAWRHNWHRRRSYHLPDPKYLLTLAALARLRDTWHLAKRSSLACPQYHHHHRDQAHSRLTSAITAPQTPRRATRRHAPSQVRDCLVLQALS